MPIDQNQTTKFWRPLAEALVGGAVLALLTWICFQLELPVATAVPIYLVIILLLALWGSLGPAIILSVVAAECLIFFFMKPTFSFEVDRPIDIVTVAAFLATSLLISGLVMRARRLAETAALKDRLQVIIDTIPSAVWSHSPDGSADFLNKPFRDYVGLSLQEGRGWAWMNALHPEDRIMEDWHAALAAEEPFEKEARLRRADGEYRRFLLRFVPLSNKLGHVIQWYATSTDIEDLKRAEEELRRREAHLRDARMQLAHANRVTATGQLAASIAHEVSQPIAAALTNASAASRWLGAEPPDLEEVRQALGRIIMDGTRASDVIGRVRALVRKAPPLTDQLDINETMREVIALTRSELRSNGTSLQTQLADGLPLVLGDRIQLQQVMLNLILNAVEAMSESGETGRDLLIRTEQDGSGGVLVAIADSGPGLTPETSGRLFDPFYTSKPGGMGMGLSICRSIIEAHGGRVWATANAPQGATFQFILPQRQVPPRGDKCLKTEPSNPVPLA